MQPFSYAESARANLLRLGVGELQGTIKGHEHVYQLDQDLAFERGKPAVVCGNTAAMLGERGLSWLAFHFEVRLRTALCFHSSSDINIDLGALGLPVCN